ncbi:unnamed protein product [Prorocentrum cordatum]|uniref:Uncharacterized protein n=1 Tax=Prorocentrum cordatum TaxID=2364126 RepID=A0ABN9S8B1_9DINO|nr:unnamed protein product [Polarella glacialis]CAK0827287.1 unnamed protein product [Polarella glacialis]
MPLSQMMRALVISLGLIGRPLLPCEGIVLRGEPSSDCLDAVPGGTCHKFVMWALDEGIEKHPDWFPSFKLSDSDQQNFKQVQEILHRHGKGSCGKPCFTVTSPPSAGVLQPAAFEIQEAPDAEAHGTPPEASAAVVEETKPEAAPATRTQDAEPAEAASAPAPAAQEAAPAALAAERAELEGASVTFPEEARPANATASAAQGNLARSNLIGDLQTEVKALLAMKDSPSLEMLRAEKRQLIHNLHTADKLEAELKARHIQNQQTLYKLEAELKALDAMDTTPAAEILRAEKRKQIEKLQTADKSDSEQTARELQRLQDPAAAAEEASAVAPAEDVWPTLPQADERPPRSEEIDKLESELKAMDQLHVSPALVKLREETRQRIEHLRVADKLEADFRSRQLRTLREVGKLEADLKALEAMDDTPALQTLIAEKRTLLNNVQEAGKLDTERTMQELQHLQDPATAAKSSATSAPAAISEAEPASAGRKPWWQEAKTLAQRRWREVKTKAKVEVGTLGAAEGVKPESAPEVQRSTDAEAEAAPSEALAAAAEVAKPETVSAVPAEEATPSFGGCLKHVPGDRCHEFVTWALGSGLQQHPDWFPSFRRTASEEQDFKRMQEFLHSRGKVGCRKPC